MKERLKERIAEEWAMLDPVDPLRGLLSDVIDVLAQTSTQCEEQPAQEPSQASYPEYDRGFSEGWDRCKAASQQQEPRNFCPRCGKRTADLTVIHTCTPPEGGHQ